MTGAERFSARDDLAIALVDVSSYSCKLGILEAVEDAIDRFSLSPAELTLSSSHHRSSV